MGFLTQTVVDGKNLTVFPIRVSIPLNAFNTSRENAARKNLATQLETFTLVQLDALLTEVRDLTLIDTEWPICVFACGAANHIIFSAAEVAAAVRGEIEFRKLFPGARGAATLPGAPSTILETIQKAAGTPTPKAAAPAPVVAAKSFDIGRTLFWGGMAALAYLAATRIGGTKRA